MNPWWGRWGGKTRGRQCSCRAGPRQRNGRLSEDLSLRLALTSRICYLGQVAWLLWACFFSPVGLLGGCQVSVQCRVWGLSLTLRKWQLQCHHPNEFMCLNATFFIFFKRSHLILFYFNSSVRSGYSSPPLSLSPLPFNTAVCFVLLVSHRVCRSCPLNVRLRMTVTGAMLQTRVSKDKGAEE